MRFFLNYIYNVWIKGKLYNQTSNPFILLYLYLILNKIKCMNFYFFIFIFLEFYNFNFKHFNLRFFCLNINFISKSSIFISIKIIEKK